MRFKNTFISKILNKLAQLNGRKKNIFLNENQKSNFSKANKNDPGL